MDLKTILKTQNRYQSFKLIMAVRGFGCEVGEHISCQEGGVEADEGHGGRNNRRGGENENIGDMSENKEKTCLQPGSF